MPSSMRSCLGLIAEDLEAHRGDVSSPGWRSLALHRLGQVLRDSRRLRRLVPVQAAVARRVARRYGIWIAPTTRVGHRVRIEHQDKIVIGPGVTIGDGCIIRHRVRLEPDKSGAPTLADGVHVGVGATIRGPVLIGREARIGPNTVVTRSVPDGWAVVPPEPGVTPRGVSR